MCNRDNNELLLQVGVADDLLKSPINALTTTPNLHG